MATPLSSLLYIQAPLQQVILDKDTGEPLAAGVVSYFSDPDFTVPKNVYQQSDAAPNGFINIGSVLTLSSIGSFVDIDGNNLNVYLYPYEGDFTGQTEPGEFEPYYITVYSSEGILQFTITDWPPNSFSSSGGGPTPTNGSSLTANLLTNPQFVEVNFSPDTGSSVATLSVSGTDTETEIAPGWFIRTTGSGTVTLQQESLASVVVSNPPYSLNITTASLTAFALVQRLTNSPRLLYGGVIGGYFLAKSPDGVNRFLSLTYEPSSGDPDSFAELASGETGTSGAFIAMNGGAQLDGTANTGNADGYVDIVLRANSANLQLNLTSFQVIGLPSLLSVSSQRFVQQSTQQQESELFWYWQQPLTYKPIPSYTVGWDFPFNPCQELGTSVGVSGLAADKSRYIADQTIAFESVGNVLSYSFSEATGLTASTGTATQFALIQYLEAAQAIELLQSGSMAVKLNANVSSGTLGGYINIYWTQDATLPNIASGTNNSLVSGLTLGVPTTGNGSWTKVERQGLNTASFTLSTTATDISFNAWNAQEVAGIQSATYIAIVISFKEMASSQTMTMRYCTLSSGWIATNPAPLNKTQTLEALQYYYETSYPEGPASGASVGFAIRKPMIGMNPGGGGGTSSYVQSFSQQYAFKRADPTVTFISETTGTTETITMTTYSGGASAANADAAAETDGTGVNWTAYINQNFISMASIAATAFAHVGANNVPYYSVGSYNFIADARLGIVL